jgi:2-polyprenyl-3-methyl-5-hydroxy-6-metoxy-1,4-benzoquinol methylase
MDMARPLPGKARETVLSPSPAPCPMCGTSGPIDLAHRTASQKEYHLVECTRCGQHYCDPAPTEEEIVGFYQGDYHQELRKSGGTEKVFGSKFSRYRSWIVKFLQGGHSIDVGTATGLLPSMLKASGFDAEGTEYNLASAEWGAAHYGIRIRVGGLEQIASELDSYDLISMTDVLEHTEHPLHALQSASRSLKPRGYMLITFPDIDSVESNYQRRLARLTGRDWIWSCCRIPLHVWEFTPATARSMFDKAGFDVVGFRRSQESTEHFPGIAGLLSLPLRALPYSPLAEMVGTQMEFMIRKRV